MIASFGFDGSFARSLKNIIREKLTKIYY